MTDGHSRLYDTPKRLLGKQLVSLLAKEVLGLVEGHSPSERLVLLPLLILQREKGVVHRRDVKVVIEQRLRMWEAGEFSELIQETERCRATFPMARNPDPKPRQQKDEESAARAFDRMMKRGKVRSAISAYLQREKGGVLSPFEGIEVTTKTGERIRQTVFSVLAQKHPEQKEPGIAALRTPDELPLLVDVMITANHVERMARRLHGGAGPGGADADMWSDWLLRYGDASAELCSAVALLSRKLCNSIVPWEQIRALGASRLIGLDKCPGVRPIGIGECLRRLCGKLVMEVAGTDVLAVCGADQLCAGQEAGIEAAIHAMTERFHTVQGKGGGVLLVDADNAFNSLNRRAALLQARYLWPRASRFLYNTYRAWAPLVVQGSKGSSLFSQEGTTQGDPLSMAFYAIGIRPLIEKLKDPSKWMQMWFADDASCCAELSAIREWFDSLCAEGPAYGYFPATSKSYLVVDECDIAKAKQLFGDLGVKVVTHHRLLGGVIGSDEGREQFIKGKVAAWVESAKQLAVLAPRQPQNTYTAITKSLQCEWGFVQRVVPECGTQFDELESSLATHLLPALLGGPVNSLDRRLTTLPVRFGGLGIPNPAATASPNYTTSRAATEHLVSAIQGQLNFDTGVHHTVLSEARRLSTKNSVSHAEERYQACLQELPVANSRALTRARNEKTGTWLTVLPTVKDGNVLSATEFRDGLALRFAREPKGLPPICDGCGSRFTVDHALSCKKGGLVTQRHNEVRDELAHLAVLAYGERNVSKEPQIREGELRQVTGGRELVGGEGRGEEGRGQQQMGAEGAASNDEGAVVGLRRISKSVGFTIDRQMRYLISVLLTPTQRPTGTVL